MRFKMWLRKLFGLRSERIPARSANYFEEDKAREATMIREDVPLTGLSVERISLSPDEVLVIRVSTVIADLDKLKATFCERLHVEPDRVIVISGNISFVVFRTMEQAGVLS